MGVITARSAGSFRTEITSGNHTFISDEPLSAGGDDLGPTPYGLLAGALAACTTMTLHFYAKREGLPLEGVELRIEHDRQYAKDCADCLSVDGYIHHFDMQVTLRGPLTHEQKEKLLSIAKRCPVYKTFTSEMKIVESLVE